MQGCELGNGPSVCRLGSVSLDTASPNAIDLALATQVEHCECPQGYAGISCEVRVPPLSFPSSFLFPGVGRGKRIESVVMILV